MFQRSVKIFLMRHGKDIATELEKFDDLSLSIEGENQCHKVGNYLSNIGITSIFSSPLTRAKQTSEIITQYVDSDIKYDDRLKDRNLGDAKGLSFNQVRYKYGNIIAENSFKKNFKFPNGETNFQVYTRVGEFLDYLFNRPVGTQEKILIVSHSLPLNYMVYHLQGLGFREGLLYVFESSQIATFQNQGKIFQLHNFIIL